jgi:hypothetical protein
MRTSTHLARHVGAAIDDGGLASDVEEAFARERVGRIVGGLGRADCNGEHRCRSGCDHAGGMTVNCCSLLAWRH